MAISQTTVKGWLELQSRLIAGLRLAFVELSYPNEVIGNGSAHFPEERIDTAHLLPAIELARRTLAPVINGGGAAPLRIAYPLRRDGEPLGAVAVEVEASLTGQQAILKLLEWGEAWLNLMLDQQQGTTDVDQGGSANEQLLAQRGSYANVVAGALTLLQHQTACTRVSLGFVNEATARLEGLSDNVELAEKANRVRALEDLFGEAADAGSSVRWPMMDDPDLGELHGVYAKRYQLRGVLSVPWRTHDGHTMVLSFEFSDPGCWQGANAERCEQAAQLLFPLLELEREQGRGGWSRIVSLLSGGIRSCRRSLTWLRLLGATVALSVILWGLLGKGPHRITAPAALEGAIQRAVVAPFDGFIASAEVRAGETIRAGQVMARLDEKDLLAERRRLRSSRSETEKEYRKALAELDHGQARLLQAKVAQVDARIAHIDDQLGRVRLTAPLDGMVITGDWSRSLDAPVNRGDVLFEVAPLERYRVVLLVEDKDIALLEAGQQGELRLVGLPNLAIAFTIDEVATLAEPDAEGALFRVEAMPQDRGLALRPGMEGIAKVVVGERRRAWIWTHGLTDWLRLQLWRWLP